MSNRAWMPLHIDDYLADTGHLTGAEHGAYMLMIMHYWQNGCLPENERLIARIARMDAGQWDESRDILAMLFGPNWSHKRIDAELAKADEIIEKRRAAADARHGKSKQAASAVQVQSKSTYTGALPSTDNLSDTGVSEEKRASAHSSPAGFEQFWTMFPNKVGKRDAEKAFAKAIQRASLEAILAGLSRYAAKTDDRPWCNPATFLNQNRWEDQPAPAPQRQATAPPKKTTHASMWTDEAIAFGIIDEPGSTQDRRLDARLTRGQDQGSNFARRIASA